MDCLVGCALLLGGGSLVGAGASGRVRNLPNEEDNLLRTGSLGVMAGEGAPSWGDIISSAVGGGGAIPNEACALPAPMSMPMLQSDM